MKRKIASFLCAVIGLSAMVGSWAYFSSSVTLDNELKTTQYGNELVEEFTPDNNWEPGEEVTKKTVVHNTGSYSLLVRIKMSETWTLASGMSPATHTITSAQSAFLTATATNSLQTSKTDGLVPATDQSVVYKKLATSGWTYNAGDGYWYYNSVLTAGTSTNALLESITLAGDTDMGRYVETRYYTTASTQPPLTSIGANPTTDWVVYTGAMPAGTTFSRSVSDLADPGYSNAGYVLTITAETLQATQEAFNGTTAWATAPAGLVTVWFP